MTLARFGRKVASILLYVATTLLVVFAITLSALRTFLPYLESWQQELAALIEQRSGLEITLGQLGADWHGNGPVLTVADLTIPPQAGQPLALHIEHAQVQLDFWRSIRALRPYLAHIEVQGVELSLTLSGNKGHSEPQWLLWRRLLLEHFAQLNVRDLSVQLRVADHLLSPIYLASLHWRNEPQRHLAEGRLYLDQTQQQDETLTLALELTRRFDDRLFGRAHLKADQLDIANWLARQFAIPLPYQGVVNLEAWSSFDESGLGKTQLRFGHNTFAWQQGDQQQSLVLDGGDLIWSPEQDQRPAHYGLWGQLSGQALRLSSNGQAWPELAFHLKHHSEQTALWLDEVPLWGLEPLLGLLPLSEQQRTELLSLKPNGQLGPFKLQRADQQWQAQLPFSALQWQSVAQIPGVNALTGQLNWQQDRLDLALEPNRVSLDWPAQWPQALIFDELALQGSWHSDRQQFLLQQLRLTNADLDGELRAGIRAASDQATELQLLGAFNLKQAQALKHYYPRQWMGDALADYLSQAIQQGHSEQVQVLWHGALADFPYAKHDGIFLTEFEMQRLDFAFLPDWPKVARGRVAARFENAAMDLKIKQGQLAGVSVAGASVAIADLAHAPTLKIQGQVQGSSGQAFNIVKHSVLADSLGSTLAQLQIKDRVPIRLDLSIPLGDNPQPLSAQGQVDFNGTDVVIRPLDLTLEQAKGTLHFNNEQVNIKRLHARLYQQPTEFSLKGAMQGQDYGVELTSRSQWDLAKLPPILHTPVTPMLTGQAKLNADLTLKFNAAGLQYRGELRSDLIGTRFDLPAPLGKTAKAAMPLLAGISGDQDGAELDLSLGSHAQFRARLDYDAAYKVTNYQLAVGAKAQAPSRSGGYLYWSQQPFLFEQWLPLISQFGQAESQQHPLFAPLNALVLTSPQISLWGASLGQGQINGVSLNDGWLFDGNSEGFVGLLHVGNEIEQQGITLDASRVALKMASQSHTNDAALNEPLSPDWIEKLPRLDLQVKEFWLGDSALGELTLKGHQQGESYQFSQIRLASKMLDVDLLGAWSPLVSDSQKTQTLLKGSLSSPDLTGLATQLNQPIALQEANSQVDVSLNWLGAPWQWRLDQFSGTAQFDFEQGVVAEISDRGGRLLSIFSVESLLRRFRLDFGDLFGSGLHFSRFKGQLQLDNGVATTDDTLMNAAIGKVWVSGSTDLNSGELDYDISFAPALTSNLPAVMLFTTGAWPLSLGTFAITKLLEPVLEVVTKVDYHLGGSLEEPQFGEPQRSTRAIKLVEQ